MILFLYNYIWTDLFSNVGLIEYDYKNKMVISRQMWNIKYDYILIYDSIIIIYDLIYNYRSQFFLREIYHNIYKIILY